MLYKELPPVVFNYIGVENVRADVKRIVRLKLLLKAERFVSRDNAVGNQHSDGFSADVAGAD